MEAASRVDDVIALSDGRSLAYAEFGDPDGRPVLFFHGTPGYRATRGPRMRRCDRAMSG
jgi:pimeloyl-ACP methyl ester carboxylesterase